MTNCLRPARTFRLAPRGNFRFFARMLFLRRFVSGILAFALVGSFAVAANTRKAPTRPAQAAQNAAAYKGAIVIDAATGNVLFEDRADNVSPPASMTKLMTFAVLHDKLKTGELRLDTPVKVEVADSKMGGTQVFLDPRETFPVEELIHAMMIQSANDAAHALARAAAGSVPGFVGLMNAKARELGMTNTTFRSPHGLPPASRRVDDGDLTTPRDFALLCRHLVTKTDVLAYSAVQQRMFGTGVRAEPMEMRNHNKLLGKVGGVDGLKTGFTDAAGYCLSATAQRNGRRVIAVIMGSLGPNGQRDLGKARDMKAIELLEKGFAALPPGPAAPPAMPAATTAAKPAAPTGPANAPFSPAPTKSSPAASAPAPAGSEPTVKFSIPKTAPKK
jgi:D-alanyl-D-alanine carboxypeptidase